MATPDLQHIWPDWTIEKQIGRGTFGTVWQAVRHSGGLTSRAAIKRISIPQDPGELEALRSDGLDLQASRTYLKRIVEDFVNEIRLMESFKGIQNIVSIEDYKVIERTDALGWDIYIRMELLTPFSTYLCDRKMTQEDIIQLGCDICTALEFCARKKIIHRDIKPENIFVNSFGSFKLGDFGTARNMESLTGGLSQKGTFNYMAPEVITGGDYDARVDIYSLGLVLYRLLNHNRLPFISEKQLLSPAERRNAFDRRIRGEQLPPPSDASDELARVILKACAFRPEDRFESAAQLRAALQALSGASIPAPQPKAAAPKKAPDDSLPKVNAPVVTIEAPDMVIRSPEEVRRSKPEKKRAPSRERGPWFRTLVAAALILILFTASGGAIYLYRTHPVALSVTAMPDKVHYQPGERLDTEGLMLTATCRDGTKRLIEDGFRCNISRLNSAGEQAVTVRYRGASTVFYVAVGQVPELSVATLPEKTQYNPGEALDPTGLTLALWEDGERQVITEGFTCWPSVITTPGFTEVAVYYADKVTSFTVEIPGAVTLSVVSVPDKTTYSVGSKLDTTGLTLEVTYSDGRKQIISEGFTCTPSEITQEGLQLITVSCSGLTTTFPVVADGTVKEEAAAVQFSWDNAFMDITCINVGDAENPAYSYNQNGKPVNWGLDFAFNAPLVKFLGATTTVTCSWAADLVTHQNITSFDLAKEGVTSISYGYMVVPGLPEGTARCYITLLLPDDPSLEGTQAVTINIGGQSCTFTFDLVYRGDYETGTGWDVIWYG